MRRTLRVTVVLAMLSTTVLIGLASPASAGGQGATQVSGVTDSAPCTNPPPGFEASQTDDGYAFHIVGDLEGCVYGVITDARCHPSGMYQEVADEKFVDDDGAETFENTFEMTEFFWAKFVFEGETCNSDVASQVFGGCKHPIVAGTGTGDYEGVTGRLDFKDDVDAGTADYKGHLRWI